MYADLAVHALVGLAPVVGFLAALRLLDSYQLVSPRFVAAIVAVGAAAAGACYFVNGGLVGATGLDFTTYSRSVGPVVEELAKALKKACAVGGTVRPGAIELAGDVRERVRPLLAARGFVVKG